MSSERQEIKKIKKNKNTNTYMQYVLCKHGRGK